MNSRFADMQFCVSVPVLSVQMTVVQPSASTAGRWRISALRLAMRCEPIASASVTVGSSPSGTFATMMPMAKMKFSQNDSPIARPMKKKITPSASASPATMRLTRTISICSGEIVSAVAWVSCAIFPNAECEPVAKTSAFASPETSEVPARSVLRLCIGSGSSHGSASRDAGSDSPVIGRVVHPHAERLHEPAVRGQDVAGFEQDHIARHELRRRHLPHCARAHDLRRIRQQLLERRQRLLGAIRLPEREHAIDHDHADDREPERRHALPRLAPFGEKRERRGDPQNDREEVHELPGKREDQRLARDFLHFIRPKLRKPPRGFTSIQSGLTTIQTG